MKQLLGALAFTVMFWPGHAQSQKESKEKVFIGMPVMELEGILKELDITYKKGRGDKEGTFFYDFERRKIKLRLYNYNGADLWIDAVFPKLELKEINRWNQDAKFSRAVLFKDGERYTTSLENQVDCRGGVTLGMVRQFIRRFEGEAQSFAKILPKKS
jgi:hypothetical protein